MDWESSKTEILLNPRLNTHAAEIANKLLPQTGDFSSHLWLMTSGTTGNLNEYKCVALHKDALLASAQAVNNHLDCNSSDCWLNPLPLFHVGGLGILARAHLSKSNVVSFTNKWNVDEFYQALCANNITLTALVPTQLHDLIEKKYRSPASLRAVVVGGGRLDEGLQEAALALNWPILPSYGLTEASSQVATKARDTKDCSLQILDHLCVRIDENGYIGLKGPSLLTAYASIKNFQDVEVYDPKTDGWFYTEDKGYLEEGSLVVIGRGINFLKIGGESVDMNRLERIFEKLKAVSLSHQTTTLIAASEPRLGQVIHLAIEGEINKETEVAFEQYQKAVLPFEKIRQIHSVQKFPRTEIGKIQFNLLKTLINK